jgi:hypothetical protein
MIASQVHTFDACQQSFGKALLNASCPVPEGVIGPDGKPSVRRFNVYRNNVVAGQISTLADAYPATVKLVGETYFRAMARDYVMTHSPATPMMFDYGADFPQFIDASPSAGELPYLGDVARIERAWVEAYHSPESTPLSADHLRDALTGDLHLLSLQFHPSTRILRSRFPALSIWEMNTGSKTERTIYVDDGPEDALMVRPHADVYVYHLPQGSAVFFEALAQGSSVIEAAERAFECDGQFELIASMTKLFDAQLVIETQGNLNLSGVQDD